MTRKTFKILAIVLLCIVLIFFGYIKVTHFFEVDACLDSGGRWNYEKNECEFSDAELGFDTKVLKDLRFAGGHEYATHKQIKPKTFHFDNYTFVLGYDSTQTSSLGLYYESKEILSPKHSDGEYDTVMVANLNSDGIPDFLVSYQFEDGATLLGFLSQSTTIFKEVKLLDEWHETYCGVGGDTLQYILPLQIRDINHDGKDDIIANLVRIDNKNFAIPCTDTVFADRIK